MLPSADQTKKACVAVERCLFSWIGYRFFSRFYIAPTRREAFRGKTLSQEALRWKAAKQEAARREAARLKTSVLMGLSAISSGGADYATPRDSR